MSESPRARLRNVNMIGGTLAVSGFILCVPTANFLTTRFGFIPVGFGFTATAGVLIAGLALALRDLTQDTLGRMAVLYAIMAGSLISFMVSDASIALASAVAFTLAELADFAVYTPLRRRSHLGDSRWAAAVVVSNAVGALTDTIVFLSIAFGAGVLLQAVPGQLVGKAWATLLYLAVGWFLSRIALEHTTPVR